MASPEQKIRYQKFYAELGRRIKKARQKVGYSQEDMMSFGWTKNGWQSIESKKPKSLTTLLRVVEVLGVPMRVLVRGCDTYLIDGDVQSKLPKESLSASRPSSPRRS